MSQNESQIEVMCEQPLQLLFVEHDMTDVELCLRELKKADLHATADVVQTSQEFAERLREKSYDLVLADYRLPNWTALGALEFLRQNDHDIPFILVTGSLGEEMAVACLKQGVHDYILKDRLGRLPAAVRRAMQERKVSQARKRAEEALAKSEAKFRLLADTIASAIFIHQGTRFCYVNRAAETMSGYTREELLAMNFWDLAHPDSQELVRDRWLARQRGEQAPARYEAKFLTKEGEARWVDISVGMTEFDGQPAVLGTAFDITERKRAEEQVRHLAVSDPLTGLANYRRLLDVLELETQRSARTGRSFALLLLDLDDLKKINDTYGHVVGSRALCRLANVLFLHCRTIDTAARYGGDEFALVLVETGAEGARQVASRISEQLANDGEQPPVCVSIGAAVCPADGKTPEKILEAADRSLYGQKRPRRYKIAVPK